MEPTPINQLQARKNQEIGWQISPDKFLLQVNPKKALDVLSSKNTSLVKMSNEHGEVKVKALLMIMIDKTLNFFSVGKTMSDTQLAMTIDMILEDYAVYKPDYFILCFKRAMKGQYGTTYDRIDGQIIFEWLAKFDAEYTMEIEHERINQHKALQKDIYLTKEEIEENNPVPMPENVKDFLKNIGREKKTEIKIQPTEDQLFLRSIRADFESIIEQSRQISDVFVFFHGTPGKAMTYQEYLEYRFLIREKPFFYKNRF